MAEAEDKYIDGLTDGGLFRPTDLFPVTRDGADYCVNMDAGTISPVLSTDLVPIFRGPALYLVSVAALKAAINPITPGQPGQLNFSIAGNSGLSAGVM